MHVPIPPVMRVIQSSMSVGHGPRFPLTMSRCVMFEGTPKWLVSFEFQPKRGTIKQRSHPHAVGLQRDPKWEGSHGRESGSTPEQKTRLLLAKIGANRSITSQGSMNKTCVSKRSKILLAICRQNDPKGLRGDLVTQKTNHAC